MAENNSAAYPIYRDAIKGLRLPLAFVDLDAFDANITYVAATQKASGKTIRVASKSIRSIDLLRRVFDIGGPAYQGILAFTVEEAAFLVENGFDDIIVAYPSVQPSDLDLMVKLTRASTRVALVIDSRAQLEHMSRCGRAAGVTLGACLEVDMSWRPLGKLAHLGIRRSPVRQADEAVSLVRYAVELPNVTIEAVMGYEAQIASVNDAVPGRRLMNSILRLVKRRSMRELAQRRARIVDALRTAGFDIRVINGGGSGSLVATGRDPAVTEVTAGSAFFAPGLFRHFHEVSFQPAAFFALQIARIPAPGMVTCQGGGYIASGETDLNKRPWPVMPPGLTYIGIEGAGEVQTPLILPAACLPLSVGDSVFFQHAKAGELCERFNSLHLVQAGRRTGEVATYRGAGKAFL